MSKKNLKPIPDFRNEDEEREFWLTHDSADYIDWSKAVPATFPNLKLTTKPITIRLPAGMIDQLKIRANRMDVPYQSLIKQYLYRALYQER